MATTNSLQTHQQTSRLDFLFEAGHTMLSQCPSLSRYYMNEFQNTLTEFELRADKPIARLSCTSCGQISIPGLTNKVEIAIKRKPKVDKKTKASRNMIQSTCLACGHTNRYHGSFKKKMPAISNNNNNNSSSSSSSSNGNSSISSSNKNTITQPVIANTTTDVSQKKKKNKGKKNNLKALLSKQQQQKSSNGSGGGLSDFLSSL